MAVVNPAEMLVDHGPDGLGTEVAALESGRREDDVVQHRTKIAPEPPPDGAAESLLPPPEILRWHCLGERLSKDPLAARASDHERGGKLERVLDEATVEERSPDLERICHRSDVDLHEEIVRQVQR